MNLNKVYLIGRLTQDPDVRSTPSGQSVASFGLATNRVWNDASGQKQEQVEFHNIVVWRRLADIAAQYLKKGQLLMVEGRLQTRNWVGQDGVKRYRTEIVADNFQMGPKAAGSSRDSSAQDSAKQSSTEVKEDIPVIQVEETGTDSKEQNSNQTQTKEGDEDEVVPF